MPGGDGTGPMGQVGGRGWRPGNTGPAGSCVCLNCGERVPHQRGRPCNTMDCPKCGRKMTRE
jgi:electron transport complex protein RnfB